MNTTSSPTISVVMAVKNGGHLLAGSVQSILDQTFKDFELIIINDGSTDDTLETLAQFTDPRIRVVSQENQGLAKSLNRGIELARGQFIARQDHDDLSMPTRFEKQIAYFQTHPHCGLLGTASEIWSEDGPTGRSHNHPCDSGVLAFKLLFNNPFVHTSWMFRKAVVEKVGLYTTDLARQPPEDYEYVSRIVREFDVANLPERLVVYREMQNSMSSMIRPKNLVLNNPFSERLALISTENITYAAQLTSTNIDAQNFGALTHNYPRGFSMAGSSKAVRNLLKVATQAIASRYPRSPIAPLLNEHLNHLYYQYAFQAYLQSQGGARSLRMAQYWMYRIKVAIAVRLHRIQKTLGLRNA